MNILAEPHIVTDDYVAKKEDEISVKKANYVLVVEKNLNGFWRVKYVIHKNKIHSLFSLKLHKKRLGKLIGLVPAVFLIPNINLIKKIKSTMQLVDAWTLPINKTAKQISGSIDKPIKNNTIVEKYQNFVVVSFLFHKIN